jgi:hypothetical protein
MTFRVLLFIYRKPGLSFEWFRSAYENVHVPLVRSMAGDLFPIQHTRRYISRIAADTDSDETVAEVVSGEAGSVPYDAITEMVFNSRQHFQDFSAVLMTPENGKRVAQDCQAFLDLTKAYTMVVLADYVETVKQ